MTLNALRFFLVSWSILTPLLGFSQQINGVIKDTDDNPLEGISIQVKGGNRAVVSDWAGKFVLDAHSGDTLQVFLGYSDFEFVVGDNPNPEIVLYRPDLSNNLDIQIGYGRQKQSAVGGAVVHIESDEFTQGHVYHPYQLIRGRVAGLILSRPGSNPLASFDANQRGVHSLMGDNQPLVVIDGFPGASLLSVDPQDVAAIDVLRESSLAAIYGARAANGVIMIRTKNAARNNSQVSYSGYLAAEQIARYPQVLSAAQYRDALKRFAQLVPNPNLDLGSATDWPREITRSPMSQAHQLAFSQNNGLSAYRFSLNYRRTEGITPFNYFEQWNGWLNLRHSAWKNRLQLDAQLGYTQRPSRDIIGDVMRYAAFFNPTAPVLDASRPEYGAYFQTLTFESYNPTAILEQINRNGKQQVATINAAATLNLTRGLSWTGRIGYQQTSANVHTFVSKESLYFGYFTNGRVTRTLEETGNQLAETTLQYETQLNDHGLTALAGYAYQQGDSRGTNWQGYDYIWDNNATFLNAGYHWGVAPDEINSQLQDFRRESILAAFFGRVSYNWKRGVYAALTYRREGSTQFGANNKWGNFYGANISAELNRFFQIRWMEYLRFRAGAGLTGALPAEGILSERIYRPGAPFYYNGRFVNSYEPFSGANPNLQWESRREINTGLDMALLEGKLALSLDYYTNHAENLLFPTNELYFTDRRFINQFAIRNRGLEMSFRANLLQQQNLRWDIWGNWASNSSVYTDLGDADLVFDYPNNGILFGGGKSFVYYLEEGQAVGNFKAPVFDGISNGNWEFEDVNRDGSWCECPDDYGNVGSGLPKSTVGIGTDLKWKRWQLGLFFRGVRGHSLLNVNRLEGGVPPALGLNVNLHESALEGDAARVTSFSRYSSFFIENASFWQLDNLVLSYEWPKTNTLSLRIYVAGQQLFTWTRYTGVDPEVRLKNNLDGAYFPERGRAYVPGFDTRGVHYPTRAFVLGLQVGM